MPGEWKLFLRRSKLNGPELESGTQWKNSLVGCASRDRLDITLELFAVKFNGTEVLVYTQITHAQGAWPDTMEGRWFIGPSWLADLDRRVEMSLPTHRNWRIRVAISSTISALFQRPITARAAACLPGGFDD